MGRSAGVSPANQAGGTPALRASQQRIITSSPSVARGGASNQARRTANSLTIARSFGDGRKEKGRLLASSRAAGLGHERPAGQRASVLHRLRLCAKRRRTDGGEQRPQHPTASLRRKVVLSNRPPDPNHPVVAYRRSSMTRADTAGLLKSGPSSWRGAQPEPAKVMVCTGE